MQSLLKIEGEHAHLASPAEIAAGINAACAVFAQNNADPLACTAASEKLDKDEELTRDEALLCVIWDTAEDKSVILHWIAKWPNLLCVIWDTAEDKAFRAVTLGWLARDVDIRLALA